MKGVKFSDKPDYVIKTEKFIEVFEEIIMKDKTTLESFRVKFLKEIYDTYYTEIVSKVMPGNGKVNDHFIKNNLEFKLGKSTLPISTIYTNITKHVKENNIRSIHPPKILLGFFSVMFHTVVKEEPKETLDLISENINTLMGAIEDLIRPPTPPSNSMFDMVKNFNPGQMSEFFNKIGQDPRMSEEFKKVHGKVTDIFKNKDPAQAMGELFKEMSAHAGMDEQDNPQSIEKEEKEESQDVSDESANAESQN